VWITQLFHLEPLVNKEALALAAEINKKHGAEVIVPGSALKVARRFTSGSLSLDVALGGGWPGNQWVEVIGPESHGKTAIVLKTIAANQALDKNFATLWIAAEHYDVDQAQALGVDNSRVMVMPTQEMESAYDTMLRFAASRTVDCIVLDSYPALIPDEEEQKNMDELVVAIGARLTGKFFRKAGGATKRSLTNDADRPMLGIIINQYRDKIGGFQPHGPAQTTPGGNAKNYAFYVRVEVRRAEWIDEARTGKGKARVGQVIKAKTIKNKSAAPHQIATLDFYFQDAPFLGFSRGDYDIGKEQLTMAVFHNVIKRRGRYYYLGERRWDDKDNAMNAIRGELDLQEEIRAGVLAAMGHPVEEIADDQLAA
jgi:recombination protein RecA